MKIIRASHSVLTDISYRYERNEVIPGVVEGAFSFGTMELKAIEEIARTCYKSEDKIAQDSSSAKKLIKNLIANGHEAMLEHESISVKFICDRAVSHELVRHRVASFAQESQRYCNYSKDKFDNSITFVVPSWMDIDDDDLHFVLWKDACEKAEKYYFKLLKTGCKPEEARVVLPNCTKTEIVMTANYREWRHILKLRTDKSAYSEMRNLMVPLLNELKFKIPIIFDDI